MKKLSLVLLVASVPFLAPAYTITNVNIGVDSNSVAWSKVNQNNANFVAWLNSDDLTNGYFLNQISNLNGSLSAGSRTLPTNAVLSSQQQLVFSTNYVTWGTSNYIGSFSNLYSWTLNPGSLGAGGMTPPTNVFEQVVVSTNATAWFVASNGFTSSNTVWLAIVGAGGGQGSLSVYGVDHPELLGHTNSFYGQSFQFANPINAQDAATKSYVDATVGNASFGQFTGVSSNSTYHYYFAKNGATLIDMASTLWWIPIQSISLDATGTNLVIAIYQTNLVAGFSLQVTTNITLVNGWQTFTNYSSATNSGLISFTTPASLPMAFFRAVGNASSSVTIMPPITAIGGMIYPSNTWSLAAITNAMPNFSVWTGSSNGCCIVTLSLSNGVVRYLQALH